MRGARKRTHRTLSPASSPNPVIDSDSRHLKPALATILTISSSIPNHKATEINALLLKKVFAFHHVTAQAVKQLCNGFLLVKVDGPIHANNLVQITMLQDLLVRIKARLSLNTCRGIVLSEEAALLTEQELSEIGDSHIVNIKKPKQNLIRETVGSFSHLLPALSPKLLRWGEKCAMSRNCTLNPYAVSDA